MENYINLSKFVENLNWLVDDAGLTKTTFSKKLNISLTTVCRWMNGKGLPTSNELVAIADCLNCSMDFLLGLTNDYNTMTPKPNKKSFAEKLKEIFAKKENKKTVIADKAGFSSTSVIYDWINENTTPNIHSIIVLAKALDCTVDYLFDRE